MNSSDDKMENIPREEGPPIPMSASDILSSLHGRQRRIERGISKSQFHSAVKFGVRSPGRNQKSWMFAYKEGGIAVVTNETYTEEITSWALPCWGIDIEKVPITEDMLKAHEKAVDDSRHHDRWKSHTVVVLDQSGSMRKTDATNGVTRSDLVWLCLAVDCIGKRLKSGEATSRDYFSLIELRSKGECLIDQHPMDWILYNKIIEMLRSWQPIDHGNYLPAIDVAENMLLRNRRGNCVLQLIFLSDGAPSDNLPPGSGWPSSYKHAEYHKQAICKRIAFLARQFGSRLSVGAFAVGDSQIHILKHMVKTAAEYNCHVFLSNATLCVNELSSAFQSMTTLLTDTKSAATDVSTNRQRTFRDLLREPKGALEVYEISDGEWSKYHSQDVEKAYFDKYEYRWVYFDQKFNHPSAVGVVVRDEIFAEGKERAVRRVREITPDGQVVGPPLVGKESLFVEDMGDSISFHKTFFKVQQISQNVAVRFNKILLKLPGVKRSETPLITFLDCYVLLLQGRGMLVEKMIDHTKYKKWNTNDGYVDGMTRKEYNELKNCQGRLQRESQSRSTGQDSNFTLDDIPQAFSHFSYIFSKRKFLICDLQGVLDTDSDEPLFELTDPVIHYSDMTDRADYGRTDRGQQGIDDFFRSHKCSPLCHMMLRRWIPDPLCNDVIKHDRLPVCEPISETILKSNSEADSDEEVVQRKPKKAKTVKFMI